MYFQIKTEILKGRRGSRLWNSEGMGGGGAGNAFWNFRRQKPSVVGCGYFLELPNLKLFLLFWSDLNGPYFR